MVKQMEGKKEVILKTPLSVEEIKFLRAGDKVHLNGVIYVARDLTHQRLIEDLEKGKELPFLFGISYLLCWSHSCSPRRDNRVNWSHHQ